MTRSVRWFEEALADLVAHLQFITERNPTAAQAVALRINEAGAALADFAIGRPGLVEGTFERVLTDIPYTIVYAISVTGGSEVVSILRVLHQAQLWPPKDRPN